MDIQLVAEKLFNFCKEKYPDLDWNFDFTDNDYKIIQCLTFSDDNIEIKYGIWAGLDGQLKYVEWQDNQIGKFKIWINPPTEDMSYRYEDYTVFENLAYYKHELWSAEYWALVSQYRKVMLGIFNFIANEIQE
ncbi:MAG: hypothetical protein IM507_17620 [Microcystis sp. M20BS1]|uniref:hypothetical protein n=1 Tax=Microcystis sp. M20BS1 TaxID=2771181 RepID=UPI00257CC386|nr:hypothetical protein [Microcystis sp. M20BS1]MCA2634134.1 hypothetical protein [Microcystis sp. M20BS1]